MSTIKDEFIPVQNNIYTSSPSDRQLHIRYSIPSQPLNESSGMLVIVGGYGSKLGANVFRHMMEIFPDKYNLVVIQCEYFGYKYMSSDIPSSIFDEFTTQYNKSPSDYFQFEYKYNEDINEFNDMGIMQATDVVTSVLYILEQIDIINSNRIILFGSSHGAYLCHLCNIICPSLFSHMVDVCGYTFPYFLDKHRVINNGFLNNVILTILINYRITYDKTLQYPSEYYDLEYLYKQIPNTCRILSLQGMDDYMIDYKQKEHFINSIPHSQIVLFSKDDIDGKIVKSTDHDLGLDFLLFLDAYIPMIDSSITINNSISIYDEIWIGDKLHISYAAGYPIPEFIK